MLGAELAIVTACNALNNHLLENKKLHALRVADL